MKTILSLFVVAGMLALASGCSEGTTTKKVEKTEVKKVDGKIEKTTEKTEVKKVDGKTVESKEEKKTEQK